MVSNAHDQFLFLCGLYFFLHRHIQSVRENTPCQKYTGNIPGIYQEPLVSHIQRVDSGGC